MSRGMQGGSLGACMQEAMSTLVWLRLEQDLPLMCGVVVRSLKNNRIGNALGRRGEEPAQQPFFIVTRRQMAVSGL